MIKSLAKLGFWCIVGGGSTIALLGSTNFHTPWKYTVHSTIPAGTQITLVQPNGESVTMSVPEGQAISGNKTVDVGAPVALLGVYILGSIVAFGLKTKHRPTDP